VQEVTEIAPNKALHRTAIPLRYIAAGELDRVRRAWRVTS